MAVRGTSDRWRAGIRSAAFTVLTGAAGVMAPGGVAEAVMLADLELAAVSRGYGPGAPVEVRRQDFAVPGGPGTVVMTFVEDAYVGGLGGAEVNPVDLSNDKLGFGGACTYTPYQPVKGQPYRVRCTWLRDFSKKNWYAALKARYDPQSRRQIGSKMTLTVEFVPGTTAPPDPGPATPPASPPRSPAAPPAPGPAPVPGPSGPTTTPAPTPPAPVSPPQAPPPAVVPPTSPAPPTHPVAPPSPGPAPTPVPPPSVTGLPAGQDSYDSTSFAAGDPFDGGEWRNARNGSATASRRLDRAVCIAGLRLASAGTDVDTTGSTITITLHRPDGSSFTALRIEGAAIDRAFSGGGRTQVVPAQTRRFEPVRTGRVEVAMTGHGWFLMRGLTFSVVPCR